METMQKVEEVSRTLARLGGDSFEEAVRRIKAIETFMDRYGDLGAIFEHFKELESKLYMCRELLSVDEAAAYLGVSKSQIYLLTSTREISHYKPKGKVIYIERRELDDLRRRNPVHSRREMEGRAAAVTMAGSPSLTGKKKGGAK